MHLDLVNVNLNKMLYIYGFIIANKPMLEKVCFSKNHSLYEVLKFLWRMFLTINLLANLILQVLNKHRKLFGIKQTQEVPL